MTEIPFDYKSCREVFGRLDDYLDSELTPEEMEGIRRHLEFCVMCADEFRIEADILEELRAKMPRLRMPRAAARRLQAALDRARAEGEG